MATNKMKLRHAFRSGGDDYVEDIYGVRLTKDDKNLHRKIEEVLIEHEETSKALSEEPQKNEENLEEKMEYLDTLDINQLRDMAKTLGIPYKNLMKMKKEQIISELLR